MKKKNTKQTSYEVASKASDALRSKKTSDLTKTFAGSALSQAKPKKKK